MRIVQSAWSCNSKNWYIDSAGWYAPEYHLMSWTLSCLRLKEYYSERVLYCDEQSHRVLIEHLKLPYSEIHTPLDELNSYHKELWALPKIYSYGLQEKPFIHIDSDVFIWKKFSDSFVNKGLIAQNKEYASEHYGTIMQNLEENLGYFPEVIRQDRKQKNPILAYNMGIFGGSEIAFIQEYCKEAFEFVIKNQPYFSKIYVHNFNIFFEQYLLHCLVEQRQKKVSVLFKELIQDDGYKGFGSFSEVPYEKTFLHLLGTYKRNRFVCEALANQLRMEYPEYYYRIISYFKKSNHRLTNDFYFLNSTFDPNKRMEKNQELKKKFKNNTLEKYTLHKEETSSIKHDFHLIEKKFGTKKLKDFKHLLSQINQINKEKFSTLSLESLYARDLVQTEYFRELFENPERGFHKKLIKNDFVLVKSKYNWDFYFNVNSTLSVKNKPLSIEDTQEITYALLPECTPEGFSLIYLDSLDINLLHLFDSSITLHEILQKAQLYFEEEIIEKQYEKYKKLVLIKLTGFLSKKLIRREFEE